MFTSPQEKYPLGYPFDGSDPSDPDEAELLHAETPEERAKIITRILKELAESGFQHMDHIPTLTLLSPSVQQTGITAIEMETNSAPLPSLAETA